MASDVARLRVVVSADTARGLAGLARTDAAVNRLGRSSQGTSGHLRRMSGDVNRSGGVMSHFGRRVNTVGGHMRNFSDRVRDTQHNTNRTGGTFMRVTRTLMHFGEMAGRGAGLAMGLGDAGVKAAGSMANLGTAVTLVAIAFGLVGALGAPLAALVGATLPAAVVAFGAVVLHNNDKVKKSFSSLKDTMIKTMTSAAQPLVGPISRALTYLGARIKAMQPALTGLFKAAAPFVHAFAKGIADLVQNMLPGMTAALRAMSPVTGALAYMFGRIGAGLGAMFKQMTSNSSMVSGMGKAFRALGDVVFELFKYIGQFFGILLSNETNVTNFRLTAELLGKALLLVGYTANILSPIFQAFLQVMIWVFDGLNSLAASTSYLWTNTLPAAARGCASLCVAAWNLMWRGMQLTWVAIKAYVIAPTVWFFTKGIPVAAGYLWRAVVAAWNLMWKGMQIAWRAIYTYAISPIIRFFRNNIPAAARALRNWVVAAWNAMYKGLVTAWHAIYSYVVAPIIRFFRDGIPAAARALRNLAVAAWNAMYRGLVAAWHAIYAYVVAPIIRFFRSGIPAAARALRNLAVAAWNAMYRGLSTAWHAIYAYVIAPIIRFFRSGIPAAARAVRNLVVAAWNAMGAGIRAAFSWMNRVVFQPIGRFFTQTIPRWAGMMARGVRAGWNLMTGWVRAAYRWVNTNVFDPIYSFFVKKIPSWSRTMARYVKQGWDMMTGWIRSAYRWVNNNVFDPIYSFFVKKIPSWSRTMAKWVKKGWDTMVGGIRSAYRWVNNNVFDPLYSFFVKKIPSWARSCATWVGKAWSKLKSLFKAPVKWVIDVVYNGALVPLWNNTAAKIPGIGKMKKWTPKGFATGGYTGSGAKHQPKGIVHGGEYVIKKSSTQKIPRPVLDHMNRTGKIPGYADGGKVDGKDNKGRTELGDGDAPDKKKDGGGGFFGGIANFFKSIGKGIKDLASDAWGWAEGMLRDGAADAFVALWNGTVTPAKNAMGGLLGAAGKGEWSEGFKSLPDFWRDMIADFIRSKEMPLAIGYSPAPAWKEGDGERTSYHGGVMNVRTKKMLQHAEKLYKKAFSVTQGSFSRGVGASAGTHDGGGVLDLAQTDDKAVGALRASGFAAWARSRKEGFSPHTHAVAVGDHQLSGAAKAQVKAFFQGKNGLADNGPDTYMGGVGGTASRWKSVALQALRAAGEPASKVNNVIKAMAKESGGNPRAINNWDSNAKKGTPSKGLMQVIQPTFDHYAGKYKSRGIYDPLANIYAAIMYAKATYGSGWDARMARPGGYANGTNNARKGWSWVGERGPELVNFGGGERVMTNRQSMGLGGGDEIHIHIEGNVLASKRELENLVLTALTEAKRKGRKV